MATATWNSNRNKILFWGRGRLNKVGDTLYLNEGTIQQMIYYELEKVKIFHKIKNKHT